MGNITFGQITKIDINIKLSESALYIVITTTVRHRIYFFKNTSRTIFQLIYSLQGTNTLSRNSNSSLSSYYLPTKFQHTVCPK